MTTLSTIVLFIMRLGFALLFLIVFILKLKDGIDLLKYKNLKAEEILSRIYLIIYSLMFLGGFIICIIV